MGLIIVRDNKAAVWETWQLLSNVKIQSYLKFLKIKKKNLNNIII